MNGGPGTFFKQNTVFLLPYSYFGASGPILPII